MNTAAAIAQALAEAGIKRVFGLPGGEVLVLIDELRKAGVDFVLMRHEANAGIAAAVYGKLNRQPGVVIATLGPGAANLLLPIANAYLDQEPLLAITAQIPDDFPASHTHQLLPLHDTFRPMCRVVAKITQSNVSDVIGQALAACMDRPYGVSYLTLSAREAVEAADESARRYHGGPPTRPMANPAARAADLRARCAMAERPLVLIGLGVEPERAPALRRWLDEWQLPFAVTPKVKGIVDETSPNFVGVISGMAADGVMVDALNARRSADRLRTRSGRDRQDLACRARDPVGARSAQCDRRAAERHAARQPRAAPRRAAGGPSASRMGPPVCRIPAEAQRHVAWQRRCAGHRCGRATSFARSAMPCRARRSSRPTSGSHKYLFGQYWPSRHPETFWMSNGLSGMAYGLSAAIGAKLARPDVPVLAAVGDGGFSMNAQELETAERVGAPFVTVVLEDQQLLADQARRRKTASSSRIAWIFNPIDNVKMAEACGVQALRTSNPDEMASAVKRAVGEKKSLVVAVPVHYADYRKLF